MKIRMKGDHRQIREVDAPIPEGTHYWYANGDLPGTRVSHYDQDWEPVPAEKMATQWVQHRSGDGDKWALHELQSCKLVWISTQHGMKVVLPKSEFIVCDQPVPEKRWVDVTEQMQHSDTVHSRTLFHRNKDTLIDVLTTAPGYRLVRGEALLPIDLAKSLLPNLIHYWRTAFIIEQEQP